MFRLEDKTYKIIAETIEELNTWLDEHLALPPGEETEKILHLEELNDTTALENDEAADRKISKRLNAFINLGGRLRDQDPRNPSAGQAGVSGEEHGTPKEN